jgi:ankyrin repeat protein
MKHLLLSVIVIVHCGYSNNLFASAKAAKKADKEKHIKLLQEFCFSRDYASNLIGLKKIVQTVRNKKLLNIPNMHGQTLVYRATVSEDIAAIQYLSLCGADLNAPNYPFEKTALHDAADFGRRKVIEVLLAHGADPCISNAHGELPKVSMDKSSQQLLHDARERIVDRFCTQIGSLKELCMRVMHKHKMDITEMPQEIQMQIKGRQKWLNGILTAHLFEKSSTTLERLKLLLDRGADPDCENYRNTPLGRIIDKLFYTDDDQDCSAVAELLLKVGACPNGKRDLCGAYYIHRLMRRAPEYYRRSSVELPPIHQRYKRLVSLLYNYHADFTRTTESGETLEQIFNSEVKCRSINGMSESNVAFVLLWKSVGVRLSLPVAAPSLGFEDVWNCDLMPDTPDSLEGSRRELSRCEKKRIFERFCTQKPSLKELCMYQVIRRTMDVASLPLRLQMAIKARQKWLNCVLYAHLFEQPSRLSVPTEPAVFLERLKIVLDRGADPDYEAAWRMRPLRKIIDQIFVNNDQDWLSVVELLLSAGACPNGNSDEERNCYIHRLIRMGLHTYYRSIFALPAAHERYQRLVALLYSYGADMTRTTKPSKSIEQIFINRGDDPAHIQGYDKTVEQIFNDEVHKLDPNDEHEGMVALAQIWQAVGVPLFLPAKFGKAESSTAFKRQRTQ